MQQLSSFTERKGGASIIRGTYALRQLLPCVCCISSFQAKCFGCLNGIFDPFWTFLIIYFCFRKEESQLHSLSYIEVPEEAFEEEIVAKDSVVNIFVNKRFAKLHESLLDVVADGDSKDTQYKTSDYTLISPSTFPSR